MQQHYKTPDNALHVIEPEFAHMLPLGALPITDEEAQEIRIAALPKVPYSQMRAAAYPPVTEQLDAIWKGGDALASMAAEVKAIKEKFPKP